MSASNIIFIKDKAIFNIINVIFSIIFLLFGMMLTSLFSVHYISSYINVIPLAFSLRYLAAAVSLDKIVGKQYVRLFVVFICTLTALCILFSTHYVFNEYLSGKTDAISNHPEHCFCYENIYTIAEVFMGNEDEPWNVIMMIMHSPQYIVTFVYSSLLFIFGGNIVTNWCVWNGFHLALIAIFAILIAIKMDVCDKDSFRMVLIGTMIMPAFDILFIYDRDIVGEFFLMLGVYIFICAYRKGLRWCLYLLPVYGFCFFTLRMQYAAVAVFLCVWVNISKLKGAFSLVVISLIALVLLFYISSTSIWDDMHFSTYVDSLSEGQRGLISTILVGIVGYFPWTNLLSDQYASYHFPMCLQAAFDLVVWFLFFKSCKGNYKQCIDNPIFICAIILTAFGFVGGAGHVKYFCVSAPLFILGIKKVKIGRLIRYYCIMIVSYVVISYFYDYMGFTGS